VTYSAECSKKRFHSLPPGGLILELLQNKKAPPLQEELTWDMGLEDRVQVTADAAD